MAFQQGLSGLNAASRDLNTIGNNVANSNTVGFKRGRTEFADMYATSVYTGGSGVSGIGVRVTGIAQQFTQGDITTTANSLDMAINGSGFFRMSNNGTITYTRNGEFHLDKDGYIVNSDGMRLTGYPLDANGNVNNGMTADLKLDTSDVAPKATTKAAMVLNLDSRVAAPVAPAVPKPFDVTDASTYSGATSMGVYDTLGNEHTVAVYFQKTADNTWDIYGVTDGASMGKVGTASFSQTGQLVAPMQLALSVPINGGAVAPQAVTLDLSKMTQYGSPFGINSLTQDGYTTGRLSGFSVDAGGNLMARFTNGQTLARGRVALANFVNPQGLQPIGGNQWVETGTSGRPVVSSPETGSLGSLQSSALESSNVDLTAELVNMITAQRAYQANAQTIKTEDTLMQTIVNLR